MNEKQIKDSSIEFIQEVLKYHFKANAFIVFCSISAFKLLWNVFIKGLIKKLDRNKEDQEFLKKTETKINSIKEIKKKNKHKTLLEAVLESKTQND